MTFTWTQNRNWGRRVSTKALAEPLYESAGGHCGEGDCKKLRGGFCACGCEACKCASRAEVMPVKRRVVTWWAAIRDRRDRRRKAPRRCQ